MVRRSACMRPVDSKVKTAISALSARIPASETGALQFAAGAELMEFHTQGQSS
jgi:hypothetical protein